MKTFYPFILLFILLAACKNKPAKKRYSGPCKPFTIEEFKSFRLRHDAEFLTVTDVKMYWEQEDFEKHFYPSPDIDFDNYAIGAILIDNKVAVLSHGEPALHDINLSLRVDSSYVKACELRVAFTVTRIDSIPPDGYKRKLFLIKVPKEMGLVKVNFQQSDTHSSWYFNLNRY